MKTIPSILKPLNDEIEDLFKIFLDIDSGDVKIKRSLAHSFPPSDVYVEEKGNIPYLHIDIALAGFSKEDISVDLEKNYLLVRGELKEQNSEKKSFLIRSLQTTKFLRKYYLDSELLDLDEIKCSFVNGLLSIVIPYKQKKDNKKTISID